MLEFALALAILVAIFIVGALSLQDAAVGRANKTSDQAQTVGPKSPALTAAGVIAEDLGK